MRKNPNLKRMMIEGAHIYGKKTYSLICHKKIVKFHCNHLWCGKPRRMDNSWMTSGWFVTNEKIIDSVSPVDIKHPPQTMFFSCQSCPFTILNHHLGKPVKAACNESLICSFIVSLIHETAESLLHCFHNLPIHWFIVWFTMTQPKNHANHAP